MFFRQFRNTARTKSNATWSGGRPARRSHFFRPLLETLEDRTLLSIVSWIGGSGDWNDTTHWSTGSLPGATDDVQINVSGITVTHSAGAGTGHTVQSLKIG